MKLFSPEPDFRGKSVLITGASSGIGAALAVEFARCGADVALLARRRDRLDAVARRVRQLGRQSISVQCDVCRDREVKEAFAESRRLLGRLDVVVANAGIAVMGRLEDLHPGLYREQFEVNVFGVLRTVYAGLDCLAETRGTLVLVGSLAGHVPCPTASAYSMSKFAVHGLALALESELASRAISVVHVSPGYVQSEINRALHPAACRTQDTDPRKMTAEAAARLMVAGIHARRRQVTFSLKGRAKVLFPGLFSWWKSRCGLDRRTASLPESAVPSRDSRDFGEVGWPKEPVLPDHRPEIASN